MSMTGTHFQIVDDVLAQSVGETIVLFHPGTERLLSLNASGVRIWQLLSEELSADGIIARLMEEFDAPEPLMQEQVREFLSQLEQEQIVRRAA